MKIKQLIPALVGCLLVLAGNIGHARPVYTITFINGANEETGLGLFAQQIKEEINTLMKSRADIRYQNQMVPVNPREQSIESIGRLLTHKGGDCFIGLGVELSDRLIRLNQYPRPVIAVGVMDARLQGAPRSSEGGSGVHNLNYIESHFDVAQDLTTFKSLVDYRHLSVVLPKDDRGVLKALETYFTTILKTIAPDSTFSLVTIDPAHIDTGLPQVPLESDAVYLVPVFTENGDEQMAAIIKEVNRRRLPSFALLGESHVRLGALSSIAPDRNINTMARRVAINVLDILEGADAGTLPVSISSYSNNFVLNVDTMKKIDYYPSFETAAKARLINLEKLHQGGPGLKLKGVILEALERNLAYLSSQADTQIQETQAQIARAALFPQVSVSAGLTRIDKNRVNIAQTYNAQTTFSAGAGLQQAVFSDDLLANLAVQKILTGARQYSEKAALLDTVLTASRAYINLLLAMSTQNIHNDNLSVTRKNLEIARNKAAVGTVNLAEVSRWESEKAANQISLNDAFRDFQTARMQLNQILDRPILRDFSLADVGPDKGIELMITDPSVYRFLNNLKQVRKFSNFLVTEADRYLPELKQIQENIKAQERLVLNKKRALYLPSVGLEANIEKILDEYEVRQNTSSDLDHPWSVSLTATWPLFTGGANQKELAQSRLELSQLKLQERDAVNQFHLDIRSKLETAAVSAREIALANARYEAALKSFDIMQAGYAEGRNSVTELVDAQNTKLNSERALASAKYQFVLDFLEMERATGRFYFLDTPDEKQAFLRRLKEYMETTSKRDS